MLKKILKKYNDIPIAAKATIWFMICSIIQKCISLVTTPIFTRLMSTTQYGQFSVYNSWLQIFTIITTLRLNYAVFNKGMSKYKEDRDGYTSTMQSLVTPAIDFWTIRKRYEYIYKPVVIRTLLMVLLNSGLGVIAVLLAEEKGYARILSCVLVNVCFGSSLFVYNLKKGKKIFVPKYAKFAIAFNLPLLLHYFSQYILDQFDRIMIQKMVSVAAAGLYGVAYNAGLIMKIVTTNVNNALVPWQYDKLEKKKLKELDDVMFLVLIFVAVCSVAFSAVAPEMMKILADEKYYEAVYVIPPVALGMFFNFMYVLFANVEFFYDQNKFTMFISMAGALLNIGFNYVGIKLFGYIAAAYTTLFCYVIFALGHYIYMTISVKKAIGVSTVFRSGRLLILSISVLVTGIVVIFLYDKVVVRYAIILMIGIFALIKKENIKKVFKTIKKK